jgi:hypothetical protein
MKRTCLLTLGLYLAQISSSVAGMPPPVQFPKAPGMKSNAILVISLTNGTAQSLPGLFDASQYCQAVLDFAVGPHTSGRVTVYGQTPLGPGRNTDGVEAIIPVNNDGNSSVHFSRTAPLRHRFVSFDFDAAPSNRATIFVAATAIVCGAPLFPND